MLTLNRFDEVVGTDFTLGPLLVVEESHLFSTALDKMQLLSTAYFKDKKLQNGSPKRHVSIPKLIPNITLTEELGGEVHSANRGQNGEIV